MQKLHFIVLTFILFTIGNAYSEVYTWIDESGKKHFSQSPPRDKATVFEETEIETQSRSNTSPTRKGEYFYCGSERLTNYRVSKQSDLSSLKNNLRSLEESEDQLEAEIAAIGSQKSTYGYRTENYLKSIEDNRSRLTERVSIIKCKINWVKGKLSLPDSTIKKFKSNYELISREKVTLKQKQNNECAPPNGTTKITLEESKKIESCINRYEYKINQLEDEIETLKLVISDTSEFDYIETKMNIEQQAQSTQSFQETVDQALDSQNILHSTNALYIGNKSNEQKAELLYYSVLALNLNNLADENQSYTQVKTILNKNLNNDEYSILTGSQFKTLIEQHLKLKENQAQCESTSSTPNECLIKNNTQLFSQAILETKNEIIKNNILKIFIRNTEDNLEFIRLLPVGHRDIPIEDSFRASLLLQIRELDSISRQLENMQLIDRVKLIYAKYDISTNNPSKAKALLISLLSPDNKQTISNTAADLIKNLPIAGFTLYSPTILHNENIIVEWKAGNEIFSADFDKAILFLKVGSNIEKPIQEIKLLDKTGKINYEINSFNTLYSFRVQLINTETKEKKWSNTSQLSYFPHINKVLFASQKNNELVFGIETDGWQEVLILNPSTGVSKDISSKIIGFQTCQSAAYSNTSYFDYSDNIYIDGKEILNSPPADAICKDNQSKPIYYDAEKSNIEPHNYLYYWRIDNKEFYLYISENGSLMLNAQSFWSNEDIVITDINPQEAKHIKAHKSRANIFIFLPEQSKLLVLDNAGKKLLTISTHLNKERVASTLLGEDLYWINDDFELVLLREFEHDPLTVQLGIDNFNESKVNDIIAISNKDFYILSEDNRQQYMLYRYDDSGEKLGQGNLLSLRNTTWEESWEGSNTVQKDVNEVSIISSNYQSWPSRKLNEMGIIVRGQISYVAFYYLQLLGLVLIAYVIFRKRKSN